MKYQFTLLLILIPEFKLNILIMKYDCLQPNNNKIKEGLH